MLARFSDSEGFSMRIFRGTRLFKSPFNFATRRHRTAATSPKKQRPPNVTNGDDRFAYFSTKVGTSEEGSTVTLIEFTSLIMQAQPAAQPNGPVAPSPEVLKALTDLMNALAGRGAQSDSVSWWTPDGLKTVASFIATAAWPLLPRKHIQ